MTKMKHSAKMLRKDVPASAWGVVIIETDDGPYYQAIPEPDTSTGLYRDSVSRLQKLGGKPDEEFVFMMIEDVYDLIEYGDDPVVLQVGMTMLGKVCFLEELGDEDADDSMGFVADQEGSPIDIAERALAAREYGKQCEHVLTREWVNAAAEEHGGNLLEDWQDIFAEMDDMFEDALNDQNMQMREMCEYPDDPEICTQISPTLIETPIPLEVFDIGIEKGPSKTPEAELIQKFEEQVENILGKAAVKGGPQRVRWMRFQLRDHAETTREAVDAQLVYITAYTDENDLLMGLARRGKKPLLLKAV